MLIADFRKLPLYMGAYIPPLNICLEISDKEKTFIIHESKDLDWLINKPVITLNDQNIAFDNLLKLLLRLKFKIDKSFMNKPIQINDKGIEEFTEKKIKELENESLINQKELISGPAGSGKTYIIKNNLINILKPQKRKSGWLFHAMINYLKRQK